VLGAGEVTVVRPDEANSGIFLRQDDRR
jgi:hypothetical protein